MLGIQLRETSLAQRVEHVRETLCGRRWVVLQRVLHLLKLARRCGMVRRHARQRMVHLREQVLIALQRERQTVDRNAGMRRDP